MLDYQKVRLAKLLLLSNGHLKTWPVIGATVEQDIFFWELWDAARSRPAAFQAF